MLLETSKLLVQQYLINYLKKNKFSAFLWFIVQCLTWASNPEQLKQNRAKQKIYFNLGVVFTKWYTSMKSALTPGDGRSF